MYVCKRCGYSSSYKCDLVSHLNRKNTCKPKDDASDVDVKVLLQELAPKRKESSGVYRCEYCNKEYHARTSVYRHSKVCEHNPTNASSSNTTLHQLVQQMEEMRRELVSLKGGATTNVTNNVTNNNIQNNTINNIQINGVGKEDISYILNHPRFRPYMIQNIKSKGIGICDLLIRTHFDKNHPENHNLKKMNKRDEYIHVYDGNKWMAHFATDVVEKVVHNLQTVFAHFVEQEMFDGQGQLKKEFVKNFMTGIGSVLGWDLSTGEYDFSSTPIPEDKQQEAQQRFYEFIIENICLKSKEIYGSFAQ